MFAYQDVLSYCDVLAKAWPSSPEMEYLISEITVGGSCFFQDKTQTGYFKNIRLPEIIGFKRNIAKSIRI